MKISNDKGEVFMHVVLTRSSELGSNTSTLYGKG